MKQSEAQRHMKRYLKTHNLRHVMDFDNGAPRISILYTNCELCPDLLNHLSPAIFGVLQGRLDTDTNKFYHVTETGRRLILPYDADN